MPYVNENQNKESTPITGVLGTTFGGTALAAMLGLFGGNGMGGLFGGNQNPAASAVYQLASKDTEIAQLKAERYADAQVRELTKEVGVLSQRVAAIEVAEPLREQNLQLQIGSLNATISRLTQPMVPNFNIAYPPPVPTFNVPSPVANSGSSATASQAA